MTRLWILSDLHQEWPEIAWDPAPHAPPYDVIVVAGDVHTPGTMAIDWLADRFAGSRVVYVLGNHDLWCDSSDPFIYDDMYLRTQERGAARGIDVLAAAQPGPDGLYLPGQVVIDGVRFLGATLWTDQSRVAQPRACLEHGAQRDARLQAHPTTQDRSPPQHPRRGHRGDAPRVTVVDRGIAAGQA